MLSLDNLCLVRELARRFRNVSSCQAAADAEMFGVGHRIFFADFAGCCCALPERAVVIAFVVTMFYVPSGAARRIVAARVCPEGAVCEGLGHSRGCRPGPCRR